MITITSYGGVDFDKSCVHDGYIAVRTRPMDGTITPWVHVPSNQMATVARWLIDMDAKMRKEKK